VRIDWDPVTTSHPEPGVPGAVEIVGYQLFVEREDAKLFEVPAGFAALGDEFQFEIIARSTQRASALRPRISGRSRKPRTPGAAAQSGTIAFTACCAVAMSAECT
jgi:hypothetical protein